MLAPVTSGRAESTAAAADRMFDNLVAEMNHGMNVERSKIFGDGEEVPALL